MVRKGEHRTKNHSTPDHRPMMREFRLPGDTLDVSVREVRRRYDDVNPNQKLNWR